MVAMGEEKDEQQRLGDLTGYRVNTELMALAQSEAVFLVCLPAHRGEAATADLGKRFSGFGPRSAAT